MATKEPELFKTKVVIAKEGSGKLFEEIFENTDGPITCLGMKFENDDTRKEYFAGKLREKLMDPEFKKIEGFPIGKDEDILALSDPPYHTVCPNPWAAEFIDEWKNQKPERPQDYKYHREPFAADVSEGKHDIIYRAHPFHTKVPHKAIMRFIMHYTKPGDIIFDGFCGTGMTGVASQMCGDRIEIESLGYKVKDDGTILEKEITENGTQSWKKFSSIGERKCILNDLSPAASLISNCYTTPSDALQFQSKAQKILDESIQECSWLFETKHTDGQKGEIIFTVWSDVFLCPECGIEIVFWDSAIDKKTQKILPEFLCPGCSSSLTKRNMERAWTTFWDQAISDTIKQSKSVPVSISYLVNGKRFEKRPDSNDLELFKKIESTLIEYPFPFDRMMEGKESRRNDSSGITHVHHFYTKQNLWFFSCFFSKVLKEKLPLMVFTGPLFSACKLYRWTPNYEGGGPLSGTLFIPSLIRDISAPSAIKRFISKLPNVFDRMSSFNKSSCVKSCASLTDISNIPDNSVDYCFIDPPFGANLNYSELNFLWESWIKIWTNYGVEAIENTAHKKEIGDYRKLIYRCFLELYRILKPGRWMTIEFSNTKASVWNSIQTALNDAGFIIANVSALDKKQGSFKAVTTPTAVKQDLVISAYKPNGGFEERFKTEITSGEGVWDFVTTHLKYLPVIKKQGKRLVTILERDPRILFDQMVAYFVRKSYQIPISSYEFQLGLEQRFAERDGMYFLPEQVAEYDRKKLLTEGVDVQHSLFVSDEASAIDWIRNLLQSKPQKFRDLNHLFMQEIGGWSKKEKALELKTLLEQNFLCYDGRGKVPTQISNYLSKNWKNYRGLEKDDPTLMSKAKDHWYVPDPNKTGDLEKLRERALLKEFETYKAIDKFKKNDRFRLEAIRAGFKKCWQERDYKTIIEISKKIPNSILESDQKLLMWYDQAVTRTGSDTL